MIKLDEEAILKKVDEIRAEKADAKELLALIGGDELEKIFEKYSIEAIIDTLIQEKKTHSLYEDDENGLTELEGLLNKKITGRTSYEQKNCFHDPEIEQNGTGNKPHRAGRGIPDLLVDRERPARFSPESGQL